MLSPGAVVDKASSLLYIIGCTNLYIYMNSIRHHPAQEGGTGGRHKRRQHSLSGGEGAAHIHQTDKEMCLCVFACAFVCVCSVKKRPMCCHSHFADF